MRDELANAQAVMAKLRAAQTEWLTARQDMAEAEVTGSDGAGLVIVTMRGTGEVTSIRFDPAALADRDPDSLSELTMAALRSAANLATSRAQERLAAVTGAFAPTSKS